MDESRFGLHTGLRRLWACKGQHPVVTRQIKYQWDYLYGLLDVISGQARFFQIPSVNQGWDALYLKDLELTDPDAIRVFIRDQAGFHLRDGDPRLPDRVRIIDLPPYSPELNTCEQLWDMIKDELGCSPQSESCAKPPSRHSSASGKSPLVCCAWWDALGYSIKQTLCMKIECHIYLERWYQW